MTYNFIIFGNPVSTKILLFLCLPLTCLWQGLSAQSQVNTAIPEETMEEWLLETDDESLAEEQLEDLQEAAENPLNINTASQNELMALQVLNAFQTYSLLEFREKYGAFLSLHELQLVPGFHPGIIEKLLPFVSLSDADPVIPGQDGHRRYLKGSILYKLKISTPFPEGFSGTADSLLQFTGGKALRYLNGTLSAGKDINLKYSFQSDAGEAFRWDSLSRGPDHKSFSLEWKPDGKDYRFIVGDYRINMASGLVAGKTLTSKSSQTIPGETYSRLRSFSSSAESGFFRGIATETGFGSFRTMVFFSSLREDAAPDSGRYFTSLSATGMHRNLKEISSRNNLRITTGGLHLEWRKGKGYAGINLLAGRYNRIHSYRARPDAHSKRDSSDRFANASAEYSFGSNIIRLSGEIATDHKMHPASQQRITARLHPLFNLCIIYRNYHPEYHAPFAGSFGETSGTQNERGIYYGIETFPFAWLHLSMYADAYRFPWPRYNMPAPSNGTDFLFHGIISRSRHYRVEFLAKTETSQYSVPLEKGGIPGLSEKTNSRIMLRQNFDAGNGIVLRSRMEGKFSRSSDLTLSGWYIGQDIVYTHPDGRFKMASRYAIFDAPHWDCRFYVWEDDMYRTFSIPLLYGRGTRFYLSGKAEVLANLDLYFKYAVTAFEGVRTSGSGADSRTGTQFRDFALQIIWKFG